MRKIPPGWWWCSTGRWRASTSTSPIAPLKLPVPADPKTNQRLNLGDIAPFKPKLVHFQFPTACKQIIVATPTRRNRVPTKPQTAWSRTHKRPLTCESWDLHTSSSSYAPTRWTSTQNPTSELLMIGGLTPSSTLLLLPDKLTVATLYAETTHKLSNYYTLLNHYWEPYKKVQDTHRLSYIFLPIEFPPKSPHPSWWLMFSHHPQHCCCLQQH